MPVEQVVATAVKARDAGATEVHIVGGLHPWLKFDYYLDMLKRHPRRRPSLHIKAFTAIEIIHFTRIARMSIRDVLVALREAGLGSMPGGGAEIFDDRVHDEVFKGKVRADKWFEVHRTAHELGIYTNATMLYGHVETPASASPLDQAARACKRNPCAKRWVWIDPLATSPPFQLHDPLSFIPEKSELGHLPGPTGLTDLKTLAIARLMLTTSRTSKPSGSCRASASRSSPSTTAATTSTAPSSGTTSPSAPATAPTRNSRLNDIQRLIREAG
jgi:aminodeoxyfutalosine synthase